MKVVCPFLFSIKKRDNTEMVAYTQTIHTFCLLVFEVWLKTEVHMNPLANESYGCNFKQIIYKLSVRRPNWWLVNIS